MNSFKIHNLEGNQMYSKNIGLYLASFKQIKGKKFIKKKNYQNCYLLKNKTLKLSIRLQNLISPKLRHTVKPDFPYLRKTDSL